ncbi:hypothetical protein GPALN_007717 [Globodera pallida]|nr:hypothetical protein GPALN_007717 [Globodera pallida]
MEIPSTSQRLSESENDAETVEDDVFEDPPEIFTKLDITEPAHSLMRYFEYSRGDQKAKCRICCKLIGRRKGNTSGMDKHLKRHSKAYKDFLLAKSNKSSQKNQTICSEEVPKKTPVKQMKLDDFRLKEKWPNDHPKSKKIDELIVRFVCLSCDAISLTEKNGFSDCLKRPAQVIHLNRVHFLQVCSKKNTKKSLLW